jgi:putative oxidoreductase
MNAHSIGPEATMTTTHVTTTRTVPTLTRRRVTTVVLWTAQILLASMFAVAALPKLLGDPMTVASFDAIGFGQWFRYLTGACELAGALGLLIPRLSGLAATGLTAVMVGATATNLFLLPGKAPVAVVTVALGVVFVLIARARRAETRTVLAALRRRPA